MKYRARQVDILNDVKVEQLNEFAHLREQSNERSGMQLATFDSDEKIRSSFKIKVGLEKYAFLVWQDTEEEAVFELQGLIQSCALPPIRGKTFGRCEI